MIANRECAFEPGLVVRVERIRQFLRSQFEEVLPAIARTLRPFSHGTEGGEGLSTHPFEVERAWLIEELSFRLPVHVPNEFYAVGIAGTASHQSIFVLWSSELPGLGQRRFWFRDVFDYDLAMARWDVVRERLRSRLRAWAAVETNDTCGSACHLLGDRAR